MPQWVERIVQDDLNVGTGTLWLKAPGGGEILSTQMGLHSVARGQKAYESTWAPGTITTGSKASTTVTVPDAEVGDFVLVSHDKVLTSELRITGHINAADTVRVVIHNPTSASVTVASGTLKVLVVPSRAGLLPFTLLAIIANLGAGPTTLIASGDLVSDPGGYDSFGISASETGPFTASVNIGCPAEDKTLYIEGRLGGGFPLVLSSTVTLVDNLGVCP